MTYDLDLVISNTFELLRSLIFNILVYLGTWKIFEKCGVKWYWAFIPFGREYHLGLCAGREKDGRRYAFFIVMLQIIQFVYYFFRDADTIFSAVFILIALFLAIPAFVYEIRVFAGLCKNFGKTKKWTVLMLMFESVVFCYFGFSKKVMPQNKVTDYSKAEGARTLDEEIEHSNDGLTVNINERTAIDFFKKKVLLKDIHMSIPKGHMVLLLGGSGAGKTTYLNAVTGYEKADAKIHLGKDDVYKDYSKMLYDIGFVPQQDLVRVMSI